LGKTGDFGEALKAGFGIDKEQMQNFKDTLNDALNAYQEFLDAKTEKSKQDVENSTGRIDELQSLLAAEIQLNQQGYASNIQGRLQQIAAEEQIRQQAIEQQTKYQKQQALIDSAMTVASTATAVANIFKTWSGVPFVGPVLAGIQVGAMLLQIAAAKQKAQTIAKFADGEVGIGLNGNPSGIDTIPAMISEGESVIKAKRTKDYYNTLLAINDGNSPDAVLNGLKMDGKLLQLSDNKILQEISSKLTKKTEKQITYLDGRRRVEKWGNTVRYVN
jgi:adenine-specific DNA methylase